MSVGLSRVAAALDRGRTTETKNAILDAAETLMSTMGYETTTIAKICTESGCPVGSVYHHFGNKAGVLAAVMERGARRFFTTMPSPDLLTGSSEDRMRTYWHAAAVGITENSDYFRLSVDVLRLERGDPDIADLLDAVDRQPVQHLMHVVEPFARDAGVSRPHDLSAAVVEATIAHCRGAVISARGDVALLQRLLDLEYAMFRAYILACAAQPPT